MNDTWPFRDPRNAAVITTRAVLKRNEPIVLVCRNVEDATWQFLDAAPMEEEAMVVSLQLMVSRDPTILDLIDLPLGWRATRDASGMGRWVIAKMPVE